MSWAQRIKGAIHQMKDAGASMALEKWLASQLLPYGELKLLKINSRDKTVHVEILLRGDHEPLSVEILEYEIGHESGQDHISIKRAVASREWVNAVLVNFLVGKKFPLPQKHSPMIRLVLSR